MSSHVVSHPYPVSYPLDHRNAYVFASYPVQQEVTDTSGTVFWSDPSDCSETIQDDFSSGMMDEKDCYSHAPPPPPGVHPQPHPPALQPAIPSHYPVEVARMQQYTCVAPAFATKPIYEREHCTRFTATNDGGRGVGETAVPQGGFLQPLQRTPRVHVMPQTHGYPCGPIVCPQLTAASHPPTSNLSPWMYPGQTTAPGSPYGYAPNVPCIPQSSIYPVVYPPPMFLRFMPHPMSPRIQSKERGETAPRDARYIEEKQLRSALTSSQPALNRNATETPDRQREKGATRNHGGNGRPLEKSSSRRHNASHVRTPSSATEDAMTHPKLTCVNDRVLSNFKTSKTEHFKITDIRGHLLAFCLDQAGSRFIQDQLAVCTLQETDAVHEELAPHALTLMRDVFGNYIIQILLENGSKENCHYLAEITKEHTVTLSLHVYGCRVVQKALEVLDDAVRLDIARNLDIHVARCIKDMNGNHVIQKAIRVFPLDAIPFIVKAVHERALSFSVHPYGCRVVQRILERDGSDQELERVRQSIMCLIVENVGELSQDLYGNYVVQHVLRFSPKSLREEAIEALLSAPVDYACHKYASNVLEQALQSGDHAERQKMVQAIISSPRRGDSGDALSMLTTNRFGNYVVQRMLDVVEDELKRVLVRCIGQRMKTLKKFKYGKHIVARVEKMMTASAPTEAEEGSEGESFCAYTIA